MYTRLIAQKNHQFYFLIKKKEEKHDNKEKETMIERNVK